MVRLNNATLFGIEFEKRLLLPLLLLQATVQLLLDRKEQEIKNLKAQLHEISRQHNHTVAVRGPGIFKFA